MKWSANCSSCLIVRLSGRRHSSSKLFATSIHRQRSSMPRIKLDASLPLTPWTKLPNILVDKLLPDLKDTELRILLVLIRSTIGWQSNRRAIVLSYRTLQAKTGRRSEAIANALHGLERRGLIHRTRWRDATDQSEFAASPFASRTTTLTRKKLKNSPAARGFPHPPADLYCGDE